MKKDNFATRVDEGEREGEKERVRQEGQGRVSKRVRGRNEERA